MKRIDSLYTKICSKENLELAEKKARKGKKKTLGVRIFLRNYQLNLDNLRELLISGLFKTSAYTVFKIYEPKERQIYRLPYYPDRIVHHAIMNVLEPIWTKIFIKNTYSCIKGRGIHKLVNDLKRDLKQNPSGTTYCLKIDIHKFYPSINHKILKQIIRYKIKDDRLLLLLDEIIDSAPGVPIGNYLSQYFANIYLSYFDHWVKEILHIKNYYRYCDDIVILCDSKKQLSQWFLDILQNLTVNLKLLIKPNYLIFPIENRGIDFVGYVFRHSYTRLRKSIKKNIFKKVIKQTKHCKDFKVLHDKASPYFGWLKYCNSSKLNEKLNLYYERPIFGIQRNSRNICSVHK